MTKLGFRQHFDARSIVPVAVNNCAMRLRPFIRHRGNVPAFYVDAVTRTELDGTEIHSEVLRRFVIIRVLETEAASSRNPC